LVRQRSGWWGGEANFEKKRGEEAGGDTRTFRESMGIKNFKTYEERMTGEEGRVDPLLTSRKLARDASRRGIVF